jgi:hypothetical protein
MPTSHPVGEQPETVRAALDQLRVSKQPFYRLLQGGEIRSITGATTDQLISYEMANATRSHPPTMPHRPSPVISGTIGAS